MTFVFLNGSGITDISKSETNWGKIRDEPPDSGMKREKRSTQAESRWRSGTARRRSRAPSRTTASWRPGYHRCLIRLSTARCRSFRGFRRGCDEAKREPDPRLGRFPNRNEHKLSAATCRIIFCFSVSKTPKYCIIVEYPCVLGDKGHATL